MQSLTGSCKKETRILKEQKVKNELQPNLGCKANNRKKSEDKGWRSRVIFVVSVRKKWLLHQWWS